MIFGSDYWNLTSASLSTLTGTYNKTAAGTGNETEAVNLKDLDLTPQFSYSNSSHDYGCESGAGLCAPVGLCWSCGDQVTSLHHSPHYSWTGTEAGTPVPGLSSQAQPALSLPPHAGAAAGTDLAH